MARLLTTTGLIFGLLLLGVVASLNDTHQKPFSPDWLLFSHCPDYVRCDLYRLDPDTKVVHKIAHKALINADKALINAEDIYWKTRISPDNQWLYFVDGHDKNFDIYRVRMNGTQRQRLTSIEEAYLVLITLSPDGQWIIFRNQSTFYRMSLDGSTIIPITPSSRENYSLESIFASDANLIREDEILYHLNPDNLQFEFLDNMENFRVIVSSPDGQRILGLDRTPKKHRFYHVDLLTSKVKLLLELDGQDQIEHSSFYLDGKWLIISVTDMYSENIYSLGVNITNSKVFLLSSPNSHFLSVSPDGEWIMYYQNATEEVPVAGFYRVRPDGIDTQLVYAEALEDDYTFAKWSPDGEWVWFGQYESQFHIIKPDGSDFRDLDLANIFTSHMHTSGIWSPDSKWLIFEVGKAIGDYAVYRLSIDGKTLEKLTHLPYEEFFVGWYRAPETSTWHQGWLLSLAVGILIPSLSILAWRARGVRQRQHGFLT